MSTRVADRVEDWDSQSFDGGFGELHTLADREFSGVVRVGTAELYMTSGVCVGVKQGSIDDFEGGSGTLYRAPSDALPLLAVMQERADEVHAKYYSEKTSIADVDRTLSDGGFTGYIELSENVLSGDYYLVYHAGTSMSVAYVGESEQLLDGDEAFDRADDEVGIYQVYKVDVDIVDVPGSAEPVSGRGGGVGVGSSGADPDVGDRTRRDDTGHGEDRSAGTPDANTPEQGTETDGEEVTANAPGSPAHVGGNAETRPTSDTGASDSTADHAGETPGDPAEGRPDDSPTGQTDSGTDRTEPRTTPRTDRHRDEHETDRDTTGTDSEQTDPERDDPDATDAVEHRPDTASTEPTDASTTERADATRTGGTETPQPTNTEAEGTRPDREQPTGETRQDRGPETTTRDRSTGVNEPHGPGSTAQTAYSGGESDTSDLEQRAVPSLDPERTVERKGSSTGTQPGSRAEPTGDRQPEPPAEQAQEVETGQSESPAGPEPAVEPGRIDELEAELEDREARIGQLQSELAGVREERDGLEAELAELRSERDDLRAEVERLQSELEHLETEFGAATDAERRMSAGEALAGTDLFVRYGSKGDATLEKAHSSGVRKENVNENLRIETHTTFDDASVAVGGQSFHEFLERTPQYQFVQWVVRDLLFEIRSTGHEKGLGDLYDALPNVDRAELAGVVEIAYTEDGQERRTEEAFDIILRDRMGNPLLAANLNDSREAATESMMEQLITAGERVGRSVDQFAAAFMVTQSFFEPGALETTSAATRGGLLSRNKRKSFVNLSRKRGYHLCLVEARNDNFHLTVPEL